MIAASFISSIKLKVFKFDKKVSYSQSIVMEKKSTKKKIDVSQKVEDVAKTPVSKEFHDHPMFWKCMSYILRPKSQNIEEATNNLSELISDMFECFLPIFENTQDAFDSCKSNFEFWWHELLLRNERVSRRFHKIQQKTNQQFYSMIMTHILSLLQEFKKSGLDWFNEAVEYTTKHFLANLKPSTADNNSSKEWIEFLKSLRETHYEKYIDSTIVEKLCQARFECSNLYTSDWKLLYSCICMNTFLYSKNNNSETLCDILLFVSGFYTKVVELFALYDKSIHNIHQTITCIMNKDHKRLEFKQKIPTSHMTLLELMDTFFSWEAPCAHPTTPFPYDETIVLQAENDEFITTHTTLYKCVVSGLPLFMDLISIITEQIALGNTFNISLQKKLREFALILCALTKANLIKTEMLTQHTRTISYIIVHIFSDCAHALESEKQELKSLAKNLFSNSQFLLDLCWCFKERSELEVFLKSFDYFLDRENLIQAMSILFDAFHCNSLCHYDYLIQ